MIERATVTAPEMIGLLAWWSVVLAAPVILLRRRRHRGSAGQRTRGPVGRLAQRVRRRRRAVMPSGRSSMTVQSSESGLSSASRAGPEPVADEATDGRRSAPASATPTAAARRSHSPRSPTPSLRSGTLEPLCRYVDFQRRLELAASELVLRLARLPAARWRLEPYPLTGERRNAFVILGETGIFVVSATYAPGHWDDVIAVSRLASKIQVLLPGYRGEVQPAICHPFTSTEPRIWHRPDERGDWVAAWLVGGDSVVRWLMHFDPEYGLNAADLERFDELVNPNWLTGAIPTAPSWPDIREAPSTDAHE